MTPKELSALCDIKRMLECIKEYCENRSLRYDENLERWRYLASKANYGLIKVRDIEREGGDKCERDINKFPAHLRIRQVPWAK